MNYLVYEQLGATRENEDMSTPKQITIDPLSACSLRLELATKGNTLGTATGFVVESGGRYYLITNWHVVAARNPDTNQLLSDTGAVPEELRIVHHLKERLGSWAVFSEPLFDTNGSPRWLEHPQGRVIDVVAVPLTDHPDVAFYPLDLSLTDTNMLPQPGMPVSIIGYPFGLATGVAWPIWKTGHIASDPDLDYDGRPAFLIDATTRGGMSGSPVVLRLSGGYPTRDGSFILAGGVATLFLGVYSGRIHGQAEIGRVWRPLVIEEILGPASST